MEADSIQDSTRYVVSDVHKGSIMPGNRAEMWRSIYIEPGAKVFGGIWGGEIIISGGNIYIEKSVYSRGSITITEQDKKIAKKKKYKETENEIEFGSVVVSPESLFINGKITQVRFNSDIYVGQLNLKNAIVYGNVYASNAKIENCIILGGVYCRKKLEITNSILFIFKTKTLKINENVSLLAPYSISEEKFELNYPVKALTFYNLLNENHENHGGTVTLDEDDIFKVKYNDAGTDTETVKTGFNLPANVYILSIAERILNSGKIIEQFRRNKEMIEFISFGNNIVDKYKEKFKYFTKKKLEKSLWLIIRDGLKGNDLSGSSSIDNLVEQLQSIDFKGMHAFE